MCDKKNRYKSKVAIFRLVVECMILFSCISGCAFLDSGIELAEGKVEGDNEIIDEIINGSDLNETSSTVDIIDEQYVTPNEELYYDEKSGQYVSKLQFDTNNFIDDLKRFWIPVCVLSFFIGFMIRRLNHTSATIRKMGFFIEIIFPALFTFVVYIICAFADSNLFDFFDQMI